MRTMLRIAGLSAIALSVVAPKVLLLGFAAERLWVPVGPGDATGSLAADVLVAVLVTWLAAATTRRRSVGSAWAVIASVALLALLLADVRVRQLWLRPLDLSIASYGLAWADDLSSSTGAFFATQAGFGMTFRRAAAAILALHAAGWTLAIAVPAATAAPRRVRAWLGAAAAAGAATMLSPVRMPYGIETNVVTAPVAAAVRAATSSAEAAEASDFEQPVRRLSDTLTGPRDADLPRFRNVILVHFESCRLRGSGLEGSEPCLVPHLRRMAAEGRAYRCRVAVPHSSKATFAMTTGLLPAPGIEIVEASHAQESPIPAVLASELAMDTYVFSVQSLEFEGIGRMLANAGFARRLGPAEIAQHAGGAGAARTSFGEDDALLARGPADVVAAGGRPFFALLMTASAHHPYVFPGKEHLADDSYEAWAAAVRYADECLAATLASFDRRGLLDDTVVAVVGDHGESFGEHGTHIHNSSLFEEEITVPLVLWTKDGSLRREGLGEARHIDVAPTIADLLGAGGAARVQGMSLLRGEPRTSFAATFFDGVAESVTDGDVKWIHDVAGGRLTRYDLAADPLERAGTEVRDAGERASVLARLAAFRAHQRALHGTAR